MTKGLFTCRDETFARLKCMLTKIGRKNLFTSYYSVKSIMKVEFVLYLLAILID